MKGLDQLVRLWRTGEIPTSALTADQWGLVQQRMLTLILQEGRAAREQIERSGAWPLPVFHRPLVGLPTVGTTIRPTPALSGRWKARYAWRQRRKGVPQPGTPEVRSA